MGNSEGRVFDGKVASAQRFCTCIEEISYSVENDLVNCHGWEDMWLDNVQCKKDAYNLESSCPYARPITDCGCGEGVKLFCHGAQYDLPPTGCTCEAKTGTRGFCNFYDDKAFSWCYVADEESCSNKIS